MLIVHHFKQWKLAKSAKGHKCHREQTQMNEVKEKKSERKKRKEKKKEEGKEKDNDKTKTSSSPIEWMKSFKTQPRASPSVMFRSSGHQPYADIRHHVWLAFGPINSTLNKNKQTTKNAYDK